MSGTGLGLEPRDDRHAADDGVPLRHAQLRAWRQEHIHARAEFHDAEALPCFEGGARLHSAHDTARENADNLPEYDGQAAMIDPDFAALVGGRRVMMIRRQELAFAKVDFRDPARYGRAVHMHIHGREKDADLLPVAGWGCTRVR